MCLFLALDLPDFVKEHLRTVQAKLPTLRMTKARNFHLTLQFLGECSPLKREKIEAALREIPFEPFEARLNAVSAFGKILWVGVDAPEQLLRAVSEIEKRMARIGFRRDSKFVPHITLARVRQLIQRDFASGLQKIEVRPLAFQITKFFLFESKLNSAGSIHAKLAEFP